MEVRYVTDNSIPSELYHHGIKGQKWGVRRYQNPDGSLTVSGRKHYGYSTARPINYYANVNNNKVVVKKQKNKIIVNNSNKEKDVQNFSDFKSKYLNKKTLAKVGIAVGAAAGVALAVGVYKYRHNIMAKDLMDTTIKHARFQRIQTGNGDFIQNKFSAYTSYELGDKLIYGGAHSNLVKNSAIRQGIDSTVYSIKLKPTEMIKVPAISKTRDIVGDTIAKDPKVKKALIDGIDDSINYLSAKKSLSPGQKKRYNTLMAAKKSLASDGKDIKRITDAWNITLTNSNTDFKQYEKIFKKIKKSGYNAIWDTNDMYTGGYQAKSPIIILDRKILEKTSDKVLSADQIRRRANISSALITERNLIAYGNSIINAFSNVKVGYY